MKRSNIKFLILILLIGCTQAVVVPPHLIGIWKTSSPRYEDRYLKFTENTLTYGIGNGEEVSHDIDKISVNDENDVKEYTFYYRDEEGDKCTLSLTYGHEGTFQLQNRNDIWTMVRPEDTGR
jgi:hypothetical protein